MKKFLFVLTLLVVAVCENMVTAQSLLNQTYFAPFNPQLYEENVDIPMGNGCRFVGIKFTNTNNGKVTGVFYRGSALFPDGGRIITTKHGNGFNQNLQFQDGKFWEIEPTGEITEIVMQNNQQVASYKINRQYIIEDNCIVFVKS